MTSLQSYVAALVVVLDALVVLAALSKGSPTVLELGGEVVLPLGKAPIFTSTPAWLFDATSSPSHDLRA